MAEAPDVSARRYVYIWADSVYSQTRMEPQAGAVLVLMGATREGELMQLSDGHAGERAKLRSCYVVLKARALSVARRQSPSRCGALRF